MYIYFHFSSAMECRCRLCGKDIAKGDRKYSKNHELYSVWIQRAFKFSGRDDPSSFPEFICDGCRRKLLRWHKDVTANKKATLHIRLHEDFLLQQNAAPDRNVEVDDLFNSADECAKKYNFQKWKQDSGDVFYVLFNPNTMVLDRVVTVYKDMTWKVTVQGKEQKPILLKSLCDIPAVLTKDFVCSLFEVAIGELCVGNPDFPSLMSQEQEGRLKQATVEMGNYTFHGQIYKSTIRKKSCTFLTDVNNQCPECNVYRTDLQAAMSYQKRKGESSISRTSASSHVPHSNMNEEELKRKLENVQREKRNLMKKTKVLEKQMAHLMKTESVEFMGDDSNFVETVINEHTSELDSLLPEDSPQKLLWESQKEAMKCAKNNPRTMRWHPAVIRWCIALHSKSPAAYRAMRDSRFIILPHQNTLNDYIHYTNLQPGFHGDFLVRMMKDSDMLNRPEHERHVSVIFDEVKIKSGLAYCAHSGKILGFTEIGSLNEELKDFEKKCKGELDPPLATHMLVLMVRGITSELQKPLAYFPCQHGFLSYELYNVINEAVELLEFAGFTVHSLVSDGASSNRKFYSMQRNPEDDASTIDGTTFATEHIIRREERLFFFCDVPHLMKTTRNNVENSGGNQNTRNLLVSVTTVF